MFNILLIILYRKDYFYYWLFMYFKEGFALLNIVKNIYLWNFYHIGLIFCVNNVNAMQCYIIKILILFYKTSLKTTLIKHLKEIYST